MRRTPAAAAPRTPSILATCLGLSLADSGMVEELVVEELPTEPDRPRLEPEGSLR